MSLANAAISVLLLSRAMLPQGGEASDDGEVLLQRVIDNQEAIHEKWQAYSYRESVSKRDFRDDGSLLRGESEEYLVTPSLEGEYRRLVAQHGRPLPEKRRKKEQLRFQKHVEELLRLTEDERKTRSAEHLKRRIKRYRERLTEALEVYDFERKPDATIHGVRLHVFSFRPKVGYRGHSRSTKILEHMEGEVFVDASRNQLARLHLRARDDIKLLAGIFGRVSEGSEALAEAVLEGDVWLLDRVAIRLDARLYFVKGYRRRIHIEYDDYQKYSVTTEEALGTVGESEPDDSSTSELKKKPRSSGRNR